MTAGRYDNGSIPPSVGGEAMPVQFRCSGCRGKLSISRRKVGTRVACPKCGVEVLVPSGEAVADDLTELLMAARGSGGTGSVTEPVPVTAPEPPRPQPPVPRQPAKPTAKPTARSLDDMPLFEREDFAKLLDPAAHTPDPLPLPLPPADDIPDRRPAATPHDPDAIVLSRTTATLLVVAAVVLLGLAFAAGFLVAG
jgi:DNA-directed RNA polymerase subunit RPC12/RpoP